MEVRSSIIKELNALGYNTVPEDFYSEVDVWKSWYDGDVKTFHHYSVYNGVSRVKCRRHTLGMAKKVCEDWADLLMNEKVQITLEGKKEQAFFDEVCKNNNFAIKINEMQELKAAYGTAAIVPRVSDVTVDEATGDVIGNSGKIHLDYCTATEIFPLSWENGIISECAFVVGKTVKNRNYVYFQIHHKNSEENYVIENLLYSESNGNLKPVPLHSVAGFENVPEQIETNSQYKQFVIDKLNIANNVSHYIPMGISVFANAIDQLKGVDIAYDSYVNEFILGKKRVYVKPEAVKSIDGEPVFDPNDTIFYILPEDSADGTLINQADSTLRTAEHNTGIQDMLNILSAKCGFGEKHYSFDGASVATATQVISENSNMFRTLKKHEIPLEQALTELCRIILRLGNQYLSAGLNEDVEISIDFDDSIIEDKDAEFNKVRDMLSMGLMRADEARAIIMNEDIETARAALPSTEDLTDEEQNEVE